MKIVIAAWHLKNLNVGLGRYTQSLIHALGRVDRENEYEILMPVETSLFPSYSNFHYRFCKFPVFKRRFWEQLAPAFVGPYDILHFPYDSCVASKRGKFVVTIHDVKPLIFPKVKRKVDLYGVLKRMVIPDPAKQIDHIITVSECSRKDIVERLGVSSGNITVVPQGVERECFSENREILDKDRQAVPFVLCVAGSDPTKNVESLIVAFSMLPDEVRREHKLMLVGDMGKSGSLHALVQEKGMEGQVVYAGVVTDQQLASYYQQASVFAFPSLYEGFGLPVLEAMACGCPVICSNTSSLPEVVGEAATLVDPVNVSALEAAIREVLTSPDRQQKMREAGLRQSQKFSWDQTARETVDLYKRVVGAAG
ncbi:MAG: glycosyltransferase family 4 protein [Nitrospirales bacterium]